MTDGLTPHEELMLHRAMEASATRVPCHECERLRAENERLRNGYGELRDMCCRGPSYKLADRIVEYIDAALAQGEKP